MPAAGDFGTREPTVPAPSWWVLSRRKCADGSVQVVLEGFLHIQIAPWKRRLITRLISIIPAAIAAGVAGNKGAGRLLVISQVAPAPRLRWHAIGHAAQGRR